MGRWIGLQPYTGNGWIRNLTVTILYLAVYEMAIFSVAFSFRGDSGGEIREVLLEWRPNTEPQIRTEFSYERT